MQLLDFGDIMNKIMKICEKQRDIFNTGHLPMVTMLSQIWPKKANSSTDHLKYLFCSGNCVFGPKFYNKELLIILGFLNFPISLKFEILGLNLSMYTGNFAIIGTKCKSKSNASLNWYLNLDGHPKHSVHTFSFFTPFHDDGSCLVYISLLLNYFKCRGHFCLVNKSEKNLNLNLRKQHISVFTSNCQNTWTVTSRNIAPLQDYSAL